MTRALYRAIEIGDAAAVRRALANGAEPDRRPTTTVESRRPLTRLLSNMCRGNQYEKRARLALLEDRACAYCSKPDAYKACGRCQNQAYCSIVCQRADWRRHKQVCIPTTGPDPEACCAVLLEAGASPNEMAGDGMAPIFCAVCASPTVLELFIGAGADVNVFLRTSRRSRMRFETPLHRASRLGFVQQVAALLAAGADVDMPTPKTPLELAMSEGRARVCPLLLRAGATFPQSGAFYLGAALAHPPGAFNLAYVQKIQKAGGFRQYEALCKKSLIALLEPKFPQIPAEVIPTIVEFWAHAGDYCMTFGPATLVRRGLEQIAARVATMNIS